MPGRAEFLFVVVCLLGPVGCAAPTLAPREADARVTAPGAGVIVAIREAPPDGAAVAESLRAAGIAPLASGGGTREYIVVIEGRGPVSVVQRDDDRLAIGDAVTLAAGPRTRLVRGRAPPPPGASAARGNPRATTVASAGRMV